MQFIFGDKKDTNCLIRECPTCDWKREEGKGDYEHQSSDKIWTRKAYFVLLVDKQKVLRIQPFTIGGLMPIFPLSFSSLFVTGRTLSDQAVSIFLIPKNELHAL